MAGVAQSLSTGGGALSALQSFAEPWRRGTAVGVALFTSAMIGLGLGPYSIGLLSDLLAPTQGVDSLRSALLASFISLVWPGWHFILASRWAIRDSVCKRTLEQQRTLRHSLRFRTNESTPSETLAPRFS